MGKTLASNLCSIFVPLVSIHPIGTKRGRLEENWIDGWFFSLTHPPTHPPNLIDYPMVVLYQNIRRLIGRNEDYEIPVPPVTVPPIYYPMAVPIPIARTVRMSLCSCHCQSHCHCPLRRCCRRHCHVARPRLGRTNSHFSTKSWISDPQQ